MTILTKPGTHAGCYMRVKGLRKEPVVGQYLYAKYSDHLGNTESGSRWSHWRVWKIDDDGKGYRRFFLEAGW